MNQMSVINNFYNTNLYWIVQENEKLYKNEPILGILHTFILQDLDPWVIHVQGPIDQGGVKKIVSFLLHTDQIFQGGWSIKFFVRGVYPPHPPVHTYALGPYLHLLKFLAVPISNIAISRCYYLSVLCGQQD